MARFPIEYYANGWPEGGVAINVPRVEAPFFGKVDSKVAHGFATQIQVLSVQKHI